MKTICTVWPFRFEEPEKSQENFTESRHIFQNDLCYQKLDSTQTHAHKCTQKENVHEGYFNIAQNIQLWMKGEAVYSLKVNSAWSSSGSKVESFWSRHSGNGQLQSILQN